MKHRLPALMAALFCCLSCVEISDKIGSNLLPKEQAYNIFIENIPLDDIDLKMADSLSGYSQNSIVIGAIRDAEGRLSTRNSAMTLIPLNKEMDFGKETEFLSFHLAVATDSLSVDDERFKHIYQGVKVFELNEPLDPVRNFDCNVPVAHGSRNLVRNNPMLNGKDSLSLDFSEEYGRKFFSLTKEDLSDTEKYLRKIPGLFLTTDKPVGEGGRFNMLELQLTYNSDIGMITGNYAKLNFRAKYNGVAKDSSFLFYLGAPEIVDGDSLMTHTASGAYFDQYALNLTDEEGVRSREGKAAENIFICGGGGIKPRISAIWLKEKVSDAISAKGGDPETTIINKATMVFPFDLPEDYRQAYKLPRVLSPTTRILTDTTATFVNLTDSSDETENTGEINRSLLCYQPDFTFHMQSLLSVEDEDLTKGDYDVWLLVMDYFTVTTDNSSAELSEYYQQLAYQSYYNNMYGGYGGGYGGYGYDSYTNYYNYMMMAQYASNNVSVSSTLELDIAKYYRAYLHGPASADESKRPFLRITFSVPKESD